MLLEKAVIEEDIRQSKEKIIVDLGASFNTQLTEIVDARQELDSFEHEQAKISLELGGYKLQNQNLLQSFNG